MLDLILPASPAGLRVEQLLPDSATWTIVVATTAPRAVCPLCQLPTPHIHSRYQRICLDLPLAAHPVRLLLHVRRLRCATVGCSRRILAPNEQTCHERQSTTGCSNSFRGIRLQKVPIGVWESALDRIWLLRRLWVGPAYINTTMCRSRKVPELGFLGTFYRAKHFSHPNLRHNTRDQQLQILVLCPWWQ